MGKAERNLALDSDLASDLRPLLHELLDRLVVRGEAGHAAGVTRLLVYVSSEFGVQKSLGFDGDAAGGHKQ